ncbi:MAG: type II toxin-antitoxin system RelE/ParE family toxin [Planctomycetia bacterium]|nr:type II toxin-antitoxin system RelE/ParE family toxin [Planctomycetia bacterium]
MTYTVVVTEQAAREMEDAATWWARERSVEQAERWYAGIRSAVSMLTEMPERCPLAAEHVDFRYALRELYYGLGSRPTHRAVFTIVKQTVIVLAVRHFAQDTLRAGDI